MGTTKEPRPLIRVNAAWDEDHKVWTADSEDVVGLHVQTDTFEELLDIVPDLVADLLSLNGGGPAGLDDIPLEILAHHHSSVHLGPR